MRHSARILAVLAGWNRGVGLRSDPADKRTGYPPLSPDDDVLVARPPKFGPKKRPPSWPPVPPNGAGDWHAGQHCRLYEWGISLLL